MSGDIPLFPLYAIFVWARKTLLFFPITNSHTNVSSHPAKGTSLILPVGPAYPYRFYRLRIIHIGFQAFMMCDGKVGVLLGLDTTYLSTQYVEAERSFHNTVLAYDNTLCQDPECLHHIHYSVSVRTD
jgi:hypothetical protein